jgi:hypothetical protein
MPKYRVTLTTSKTVEVTAIDKEDALEKAEAKVNKTNDKWIAETAWLKTGEANGTRD